MKKTTINNLIKDFKSYYLNKCGENLDFRSKVYALNNYGLYPDCVYQRDVDLLLQWAKDLIRQNNLTEIKYNSKMALDEIRTIPFKSKVLELCNDILLSSNDRAICMVA
tara:strand:+ start:4492 stop:4818 length:327 start_codon:yes stop_codon:yes gene_type:complete